MDTLNGFPSTFPEAVSSVTHFTGGVSMTIVETSANTYGLTSFHLLALNVDQQPNYIVQMEYADAYGMTGGVSVISNNQNMYCHRDYASLSLVSPASQTYRFTVITDVEAVTILGAHNKAWMATMCGQYGDGKLYAVNFMTSYIVVCILERTPSKTSDNVEQTPFTIAYVASSSFVITNTGAANGVSSITCLAPAPTTTTTTMTGQSVHKDKHNRLQQLQQQQQQQQQVKESVVQQHQQ